MFSNFMLSILSALLGAILFYEYKYLPLKSDYEQLESMYNNICPSDNEVV